MKRSLIRFCGTILGVIGCWPGANAAEKQIGGTIYTDNSTYLTISGFAVFKGADDNTTAFVNKYCPNGNAATGGRVCTDTNPTTGTGTGSGTSGGTTECYDAPDLATECLGQYYCNGTGVYCTREGFFSEHGFTSGMYGFSETYWSVVQGAIKFVFAKCANAYYQSSTGGACNAGTTTSNINNLSGCCSHCPSYVWSASGGTTFPYGGSECSSGWCIGSTGGGITSCYAYPQDSSASYTDSAGTYTFAMTGAGCPYVY